jgi:hypothetical protein
MINQQIIRYIKFREAWREALWKKSNSLSSFWNGLISFGLLLIHFLTDKNSFLKEITEFSTKRKPNLLLWFSLVWGLLGLFDSIIGLFGYFSAQEEAERNKRRVEELEIVL